jgi:hypothetical protein
MTRRKIMNDNQTTATKKGGFIHKLGVVPVANVQAAGGSCGQPSNALIQISGSEAPSSSPVAVGGCCGEPAEKQGCCG